MKNKLYNVTIVIVFAIAIGLALIAAAVSGCTKESDNESIKRTDDNNAVVNVSFFLPQAAWTKVLSVSPTQVSNVNVYVCNTQGQVVKNQYLTGTLSLSVPIQKGAVYNIYAIANAGKEMILKDTSEILNSTFNVSSASALADASGGVIMSGKAGPIVLSDGISVPITLTRGIAKVILKGDKSSLNSGVTIGISSATLKNVPKSVKLFKISKAASASEVMEGDLISGSDLADFFSGGITFYMFENMQGTLLPSNTDQTQKVWPYGSAYSNICSYIQLNASYASSKHSGNLLYRFYLGKDMTTNFDVERNTQHTITVFFAGEGSVDENTWRVDTELLTDLVTSVSLSPSKLEFAGFGETLKLTASIMPLTASDRSLIWSSSNISIATVDQNGNVTSRGIGNCTITATSCDGGNISASASVSVVAGEISFPAGQGSMYDGETSTITWAQITPAAAVPVVTSSNASVVSVISSASGGVTVKALKPGTAVLTAKLGTATSSYAINVEELKVVFTTSSILNVYLGFNTAIGYSISPSRASGLKLKWEYADQTRDGSFFVFSNTTLGCTVRGTAESTSSVPTHAIKVSFVDFPSKSYTKSIKVLPAIKIAESNINLLANAFVTKATGNTYSDIAYEHYVKCQTDSKAAITWNTSHMFQLPITSSGKLYTDASTYANGVYTVYASVTDDVGTVHQATAQCTVWEEINVLGISEYTQEGEEDGYPYFTISKTIDTRSPQDGKLYKCIGDNCISSPDFQTMTLTHIQGAVGDPSYEVDYTVFTFDNPFDSHSTILGYKYRYYISDASWIQ
ncbi:MAG TPA: DUF4906 domain-containing protein [Candidatus Egerieousia sp.]|nr:DUF4906 domain-containing protein [Candidatus Egerieousia sp.]HPT05951.1 DUF4906 domain-containing protein [Candidatus Egerieousia sp.]